MKIFILILCSICFYIAGCAQDPPITQPTNPNAKLIEQIQQDRKDDKKEYNFQSRFKNQTLNLGYTVESVRTSFDYLRVYDLNINLSPPKYIYNHKIKLLLSCGSSSDFKSFAKTTNKKIQWKISDKLSGQKISDNSGYIEIIFSSMEENKYDELEIKTDNKRYYTKLNEKLVLMLDPTDCE